MAERFKRLKLGSWNIETESIPKIKKYNGVVMFPTAHDIHEGNLERCLWTLKGLLDLGNRVLMVTKADNDPKVLLPLKNLLYPYIEQVEFRVTIGAMNDELLKFWEPNAPSLQSRVRCICFMRSFGFKCSLSVEPMLSYPYIADALCADVSEIWIGLMNRIKGRVKDCDNEFVRKQVEFQKRENIQAIYDELMNNPKIRWKDSVKKLLRKRD